MVNTTGLKYKNREDLLKLVYKLQHDVYKLEESLKQKQQHPPNGKPIRSPQYLRHLTTNGVTFTQNPISQMATRESVYNTPKPIVKQKTIEYIDDLLCSLTVNPNTADTEDVAPKCLLYFDSAFTKKALKYPLF